MSLPVQVGLLALLFGLTTGVAELAGAANLGTSLGIAQVVFTAALVGLLLKR